MHAPAPTPAPVAAAPATRPAAVAAPGSAPRPSLPPPTMDVTSLLSYKVRFGVVWCVAMVVWGVQRSAVCCCGLWGVVLVSVVWFGVLLWVQCVVCGVRCVVRVVVHNLPGYFNTRGELAPHCSGSHGALRLPLFSHARVCCIPDPQ